jgi:tetratricopeptide (TPR) repeat protein
MSVNPAIKKSWTGVLGRIIIPRQEPFTAVLGAGVGLAGDLANFVTEAIKAPYLLILFGVLTIVLGALCLRKAQANLNGDAPDPDAAAKCRECDSLRISLYATIAFGVLMVIGQGDSATARIGQQLGLIQSDVADIREAMSTGIPVKNPRTAEEMFGNAYIYFHMRRDTETASQVLERMYREHNPKKLDAADLYQQILAATLSPSAIDARMEEKGQALSDPSFFVLLARRNSTNPERAEAYRQRALAIDPTYAYALWDPLGTGLGTGPQIGDTAGALEYFPRQIERIDAFIDRIQADPPSRYFFVPQYQVGGLEQAQGLRRLYQQSLESNQKLAAVRRRNGY